LVHGRPQRQNQILTADWEIGDQGCGRPRVRVQANEGAPTAAAAVRILEVSGADEAEVDQLTLDGE
jgi:hypothetical protein